jgi:enterochelin esterase-like enzyme
VTDQAIDVGHDRLALARAAGVLALLVAFLAVGGWGVHAYLLNYWLYRGFAPPRDPAFVKQRGTTESISVRSAALGGRSQQVLVYLPPGYASHPHRRYPVLYLLHGFPGRPAAFLLTVRMGVVEDVLTATRRARPLILVMPFGSTGTFTDKEWANGYRSHEGWETFVARDVVRAIDARYRTIPTARGRALAGLSEGGYAAFNIGLHHPHEFHVLESWSGYERADKLRSIFDGQAKRIAWNSPLVQLGDVARTLRRSHAYFWFYSGTTDRLRAQNTRFARELAALRIHHRWFDVRGGHNWALWRGNAARAYLAAADHLHA